MTRQTRQYRQVRPRQEHPKIRRNRRQAERLLDKAQLCVDDPSNDKARGALVSYMVRCLRSDQASDVPAIIEGTLGNLELYDNALLGECVHRLTREARRRARIDQELAEILQQLAALNPIIPNPKDLDDDNDHL